MEKQNYIFVELTKHFAPELAQKIKKTPTGYKTYPALREYGHKLIADFKTGVLEHWRATKKMIGQSYEYDIEKEFFRISKNTDGFLVLTKI
jgi:hypothetical protein